MATVNRPWKSTFEGATQLPQNAGYLTARSLDQVHKLARNFIASIDLGSGPMKLVNEVDHNVKIEGMTGKERYLLWVKTWKTFYRALSELIRYAKKNLAQEDRAELLRLKETAQVMLNARHVGKLASWAIVQRNLRLNGPMVLTTQLNEEQIQALRKSWNDDPKLTRVIIK